MSYIQYPAWSYMVILSVSSKWLSSESVFFLPDPFCFFRSGWRARLEEGASVASESVSSAVSSIGPLQ